MKILAIASVENGESLMRQIKSQYIQPNEIKLIIDNNPVEGVKNRRARIAANHNRLKQYVQSSDCDLVWQLEQDTILQLDSLEMLIEDYNQLKGPNLGYVSGIQVGRHGVYCIGAWHVEEDEFYSINPRQEGLQTVDATGWYCLLAPREAWLAGESHWSSEQWGPDVNWGLSLREQGYKIYVDMDVETGHDTTNSDTNRGIIWPDHVSVCQVKYRRDNNEWRYTTR